MMEALIGEMFFIWSDRALQRCFNYISHSCTKLGNRDFVSKFAERIEDSTP